MSNVAYSIWKDSSPTWGKLCKGCKRENHFICRCWSVRKVAEEVEEGDQFCIDSVIQDTKKPRTINFETKEIDKLIFQS